MIVETIGGVPVERREPPPRPPGGLERWRLTVKAGAPVTRSSNTMTDLSVDVLVPWEHRLVMEMLHWSTRASARLLEDGEA